MGRLHDIIKTLLGRSEAQIELARMRAEFASLMLDVSNAMEKLKTASLKFAKRDTRAMGEAFDVPEAPVAPPANDKWARRAVVMGRRAQRSTATREQPDVSSDQSGKK